MKCLVLLLRSPPPGRGVKTLPGPKGQRRVSGGVSAESSRGPGDPPKKVKNESPGDSGSQKSSVFDSGDSFLTFFRPLGDSPGDSPGDSFLTFWAGEGFDSSARRGGSQR